MAIPAAPVVREAAEPVVVAAELVVVAEV